jgi:CheY-like chemotaxis protein
MARLSHLNRAFVVEDEGLIAMDLVDTLREAGVAVVTSAATVDEALTILETQTFDVAAVDLHLGRAGWSYAVARRLIEKGVPFVFTSGTSDIAEDFRDVPLVSKPYSAETLVAALEAVTETHHAVAAQ